MDNQNNKPAARDAGAEEKTSSGQHRSRRHHHRGKRHHRPEGATAEQKSGTQGESASRQAEKKPNGQNKKHTDGQGEQSHRQESKSRDKGAEQKNAGGRNGSGKNNEQKNANDRSGAGKNNGRNRNRGHGKSRDNRFSGEKRPYDPYEEPIAEELSLAELRSRIVLQSADAEESPLIEDTVADPPSIPAECGPIPFPSSLMKEDKQELEEPVERVEIVGVRFRSSGKMYYFDPKGITAKKGDSAIVETARGPEFGDVCLGNSMVRKQEIVAQLRPLLRIATPEDIAHNEENCKKEKEALVICQQKIQSHKLEMKLIDAQYAFDNSKLLFYFTADGRVDFRELVKDLASVFRTRIELRQIGIRDEAKLLGGIGACGRPLCCSTFLPDFAQVSIKMAKEQNLSLNSSKISGVCGRLMCCLRYESEVYAEEIRRTPPHDALVKTEDGIGKVISSNPLAGTIRVILKDDPDAPPKQYHRDSVTVLEREKRAPQERKSEKNGEKAEKKA